MRVSINLNNITHRETEVLKESLILKMKHARAEDLKDMEKLYKKISEQQQLFFKDEIPNQYELILDKLYEQSLLAFNNLTDINKAIRDLMQMLINIKINKEQSHETKT